jgi:hypothetical protein
MILFMRNQILLSYRLQDQNEFERLCTDLEARIRELEDRHNNLENQNDETSGKSQHYEDITKNKIPAKFEEMTRKIKAVQEALNKTIDDREKTRKNLIEALSSFGGKPLNEVEPDELENRLQSLSVLKKDINNIFEETGKVEKSEDLAEKQLKDLYKDLVTLYFDELEKRSNEGKKKAKDFTGRVNEVDKECGKIESDVKEKLKAVVDLDKISILDKIKKRANEIQVKDKKIIVDN